MTAAITIPATIDSEFEECALMIYSENLVHLISTYTEEQRKSLVMTIEITDKGSLFEFICGKDKIDFVHLVPKKNEIEEIGILMKGLEITVSGAILLDSHRLNGGREYFFDGLNNCLSFIEDDVRNNAIAIYQDQLIANDNRHIYMYGLIDPLPITAPPLSLHKKVAKTILNLNAKKGKMEFFIIEKQVYIYDEKYGFKAKLNNSMSNITPPTTEDLIRLAPTESVFSYSKKELQELLNFFIGFYTNKVSYKTLWLETLPTGIKFTLKNSGVVGYNSSHVERTVDLTINKEYSNVSSVVLITSMIDFIHNLDASDIIDFYMDNEHRAVILRCNRQEIYLPKLGEINV